MALDASSPVSEELDARVEQMLRHMDQVHADVLNKFESTADDVTPLSEPLTAGATAAASGLDAQVDAALAQVQAAAQRTTAETDSGPTADQVTTPVPAATSIKDLDEQLSATLAADDEFADGSELVEGQSLDVPLPSTAPVEVAPVAAMPEPAVAVAPAPPPPAPVAAPVDAPASATPPPPPAPVLAVPAAPVAAPVVKSAAPMVAAIKPAAVVVAKTQGPTLADRFWTVATPFVEPFAVRLGKLPVGFQQTVGWVGIVTLFMAGATWGYVLMFQETRHGSHIAEQESKGGSHSAAGPASSSGETKGGSEGSGGAKH